MSHAITSYACRKNMFYNQTSLNGFSTVSLAFSAASVIPALLKPFIAISLPSLRVSTSHVVAW